jgi:hypothetical protein
MRAMNPIFDTITVKFEQLNPTIGKVVKFQHRKAPGWIVGTVTAFAKPNPAFTIPVPDDTWTVTTREGVYYVYRDDEVQITVPKVQGYFYSWFNQAKRRCEIQAVLGEEILFSYTMPRGAVYLGIGRWIGADYERIPSRSVPVRSLPKKWREAVDAQNGELPVWEMGRYGRAHPTAA